MTPKEWAQTWKSNNSALEQVWIDDVRASNPAQAIKNLDQAFRYAMQVSPLRPSSGLVEMQRILAKQKKC
jgi:hypothetical protein